MGNSIKKYRQLANITQDVVAKECLVDRATVSKWESGEFLPRADKLPQLAKLLGCTVDELLQQGE